MFHVTVMRTSGVIVRPPEVPVRKILPLTTVVSLIDAVSTVTPFVVPPPPDIERPVMQAQDFSICRLTKSREFLSSFRLSASSPVPMLPRDSAKDLSPFFLLGRVPPLRGDKSPPAGEALLQPPADDYVVSGVDVPNTAGQCELFPGSESLCSLPACATVRSVLSAGPSGTGSVFRISMTLPEGSSTSATPVTPGEDGSLQSGLPSRPYRYSESGDLLCTNGNPA